MKKESCLSVNMNLRFLLENLPENPVVQDEFGGCSNLQGVIFKQA